jgi:hypothetical protein
MAEFNDDHDPLVLVSWQIAALTAGATKAADLVPLSRELDRLMSRLQLDELEQRRRRKALQAGL